MTPRDPERHEASPPSRLSGAPKLDVPILVISESQAVGQAIIRSQRFRGAHSARPASVLDAEWVCEAPRLIILVDTPVAALKNTVRTVRRRWPQGKVLVVGLPNREDALLGAFAAGIDGAFSVKNPWRR